MMAAAEWAVRLRRFIPGFLDQHPALRQISGEGSALLHGSTARGVDDAFSDLDVWLLLPQTRLDALRHPEPCAFFPFALGGKEGHLNLEARQACERRVARCDFPRIAELRICHVLTDPDGWAAALVHQARRAVPDAVRHAWFRYHYVEMRSEHRACDNPIERGDAGALLIAATRALEHAAQAALVLDGYPYPYSKWLFQALACTPTGQRIAPLVADVLGLLAADALRAPGPEKQHPLSQKLREIRHVLVGAARSAGIDAPWLDQWWLFIDEARDGVRAVRWPASAA